MEERGPRVAIVGTGIGGAALAKYLVQVSEDGPLAKRWCSVTLFERRLAPDAGDGGSLVIHGEGLEVLAELGLCPAALAAANKARAPPATEARGEVNLVRDVLMSHLMDSLRELIDLRVNSEVTAVRETQEGAELDHRPLLVQQGGQWARNQDIAVATEAFDFVIGADGNGPSSSVARCIVGEAEAQARIMPLLILQALLPSEDRGRDAAPNYDTYLRNGPHGVVGKFALGTSVGRASLDVPAGSPEGLRQWEVCTVWSVLRDPLRNFPRRETWAQVMKERLNLCKDEDMAEKASALIDRAEACAGQPTGGGRLHGWVPFTKDSVQRWHSPGGRLILLGDSAHLMPPTLGWGASCAMGDARALAATLAEVASLKASGAAFAETLGALQRYEAARRKAVEPCVVASQREARKMVG